MEVEVVDRTPIRLDTVIRFVTYHNKGIQHDGGVHSTFQNFTVDYYGVSEVNNSMKQNLVVHLRLRPDTGPMYIKGFLSVMFLVFTVFLNISSVYYLVNLVKQV